MKKIFKIIIAIMPMLTISNAFAQVSKFGGLSVFASTGSNTWKVGSTNPADVDSSNPVVPVGSTVDSVDSAGAPLFLGVEYTYPVNEKFTLGVSVEGNVLGSSSVGGSRRLADGTADRDFTAQVKTGAYQISLVPGMLVGPHSLLYGKVGYYSASTDLVIAGETSSYTSSGMGYGLGLKQILTKNFFVFGEIDTRVGIAKNQTSPDKLWSFDAKLDGTSFLIGAGYKF